MRPQDLVLTILGMFLKSDGDEAWSGGMVELLDELGSSDQAARAALSRLVSRGMLERVKRGREVSYRLTTRARETIAVLDRRAAELGRRPMDGRWTVLWHSMPDSMRVERASLATRLRLLGFGSVQDATWIAAHDREKEVLDVLDGLGIAKYAYVLVGRPPTSLDSDAVRQQAWDLDGVIAEYYGFLDEFGAYKSKASLARLSDAEVFNVLTRATHIFRGFPSIDPELPDEAMPDRRARQHAVSLYHQLNERLYERAQRHFDQVAGMLRSTDIPASAAS